MNKDLIPAANEFDFSKYRPGDVIVISMREIARRGQAGSTMLIAAICNAATRAGLDWATERDDYSDELRVWFSEPNRKQEITDFTGY